MHVLLFIFGVIGMFVGLAASGLPRYIIFLSGAVFFTDGGIVAAPATVPAPRQVNPS